MRHKGAWFKETFGEGVVELGLAGVCFASMMGDMLHLLDRRSPEKPAPIQKLYGGVYMTLRGTAKIMGGAVFLALW